MRIGLMGLSLSMVLAMAAGAWADPPPWAGNKGGGQKEERSRERDDDGRGERSHKGKGESRSAAAFSSRDQGVVRSYYTRELEREKKCPPGLAKKNNGCLPPGQARKYQIGQPLPRDVESHELPLELLKQLGISPDHRYVRVASDILKISTATNQIIDAIKDLGMR